MNATIPKLLAEQLVVGIMENYPEAGQGCALQCTHWIYSQNRFEFEDTEDGTLHTLTEKELLEAVPLMFTEAWPRGCTPLPAVLTEESVENWLCQADAIDFDAFVQLAIIGKVVYG